MQSEAGLTAFEAFERAGWSKAADAYHAHWGGLSCQSVDNLLDAARVSAGSRVIDVASGAGYVAAAAALRGADVTGTDFCPEQVVLAQRISPDVAFEVASATDLPIADGSCDAIVVGFGVNHLPDPEAAFREARRALCSGGWLAFTVWALPESNPASGSFYPRSTNWEKRGAKLPTGPSYFRFAEPQQAREALESCGFTDTESKMVPQTWHHETPDQLFEAFNEGAVRATAMLRAQPAAARQRIKEAVRCEVAKLRKGRFYEIPVPALLTCARKP